jgi:hypothetical protein
MNTNDISGYQEGITSRKRLVIGGSIFVIGQLSFLLIPVIAGSGLPDQVKIIFSGLLLFGVPEMSIILTVAILGKQGFLYLKRKIFRCLGKLAPADRVSDIRYRFGLILFIIPLVFGWIAPYCADVIPGYASCRILYSIAGDSVLIVSLFILGGEFWEKVHALFRHDAYVVFPEPQTT